MRSFAIIILLLAGLSANAQIQQGMDILSRFDARFNALDTLIFHSAGDNHVNAMPLKEKMAETVDRSALNDAIDMRMDAEIGEIKNETGLKLTGQVYYRMDGDLGLDEGDDAISRYNGKIQAEMRWYPFQSALFKRKGRMEEVRIQGEIDKLAYDKEDLGMLIALQKEAFRQYSDSVLAGYLIQRIRNLHLLSEAYNYLLKNENISSDDLLQIVNEKAEAERQLAAIPGKHTAAIDLSAPSGYIIQVDTAQFLEYVAKTQADLYSMQLHMQLMDQREKNTSYWTEVNAAPFVRYSYYTRNYAKNSSNVDAGVVFTIPISFEFWKKKASYRAQRNILEQEEVHFKKRLFEEIYAILLDIERYNKASIGEYQRMQELKQYLTLRKEAYDNRVGEYNRLARIKEYNAYILCCEKFIEFQYRTEISIAELQRYLTSTSILDFCREIPLSDAKKHLFLN